MPVDQDLEYLAKGTVDLIDKADLKAKLARGKQLTIKVGFDPTAPDIHLGHTVVIRKLKPFRGLFSVAEVRRKSVGYFHPVARSRDMTQSVLPIER